jgi:hypothetical protein
MAEPPIDIATIAATARAVLAILRYSTSILSIRFRGLNCFQGAMVRANAPEWSRDAETVNQV